MGDKSKFDELEKKVDRLFEENETQLSIIRHNIDELNNKYGEWKNE